MLDKMIIAIAAKIFNLMLLNRIRLHVDPLLRKTKMTSGQILTVRSILEGVKSKNLPMTLLFIDFSKVLDSINRKEKNHVIIKYGIPKEITNAIMMQYKITQSMVRSPYGDTSLFKITTGVLQYDTLAPFLFIICLDYVLNKNWI